MKNKSKISAQSLHENVPPGWYYNSIRINLLQRYWHKRRFEEVSKLIDESGGKLLDIGSSDGTFTKVLLDKSKADSVIGIDVLDSSVKWANNHWRRYKKMKFIVGDAHKLKFKPETFDGAFALEVLEHVFKPKEVLKEVKRVLKKRGYAVFLVPSDSILFNIIWFFWTKSRGRIWDNTHIQTYRNNYLPRLAREVNLRVIEDKKFLLGMLHVIKVEKINV